MWSWQKQARAKVKPSEVCDFLEWDSNFFGFRIGRVRSTVLNPELAKEVDAWATENQIDGLYFLAESNNSQSVVVAEDFHYRLQDVRLIFEYPLSKPYAAPDLGEGVQLRFATSEDVEALKPLTQNAFSMSRFYNDPHFSPESRERLYEVWLTRSIKEDFADRVIIATQENEALAYITCQLNRQSKIGSIGLLGVAEAARGKQLGQHLVYKAYDYFRQEGMETVTVVTQMRNISAQRLYQACGFRTLEVHLWYHKWYSK
jgi:dTDP-4-amino-4,6-dideoxy-D-galactose acyltransferase